MAVDTVSKKKRSALIISSLGKYILITKSTEEPNRNIQKKSVSIQEESLSTLKWRQNVRKSKIKTFFFLFSADVSRASEWQERHGRKKIYINAIVAILFASFAFRIHVTNISEWRVSSILPTYMFAVIRIHINMIREARVAH